MGLFLNIFYFAYVAIALSPLAIIFILQNKSIQIPFFELIVVGCIVPLTLVSWLYIFCIEKHYQNTDDEQMKCDEIEIAEPKYIPIYIAYFVIAVSIDNWLIFIVVFVLIYLLILKGKFSYFNPYLLFFGYHFYEVSINMNQGKNAKYKIFLISKRKIKAIKKHNHLIRLNDFAYLDKEHG
ncbi:Uncharacterised protein [Helicobacter mustelae]|uniref:hypothetical protein n=1 Tax=Helicobacter mustelae TaxID=217 RepID=UPI000E069119|nr:hypothetical protein [Helicobacter mustelae]STP12962.1 Uncharacterised protein [Helicobacter mustelae]